MGMGRNPDEPFLVTRANKETGKNPSPSVRTEHRKMDFRQEKGKKPGTKGGRKRVKQRPNNIFRANSRFKRDSPNRDKYHDIYISLRGNHYISY